MSKTSITVDHIARVEGHGTIHVVIEGGEVRRCEMQVVEPARLFESMVIGRKYSEIPYIASRICGICSANHVITNLKAVEKAFDIQVSERTWALRDLLVYGSYIQNHATHLYVLAAPDYLGMPSVFPLAKENPELLKSALDLKALGNELCNKIGGRSIHPITAVTGGFTSEISSAEYLELADKLEAAIEFAVETVDVFDGFATRRMATAGDLLAMVADDHYAISDSDTACFLRECFSFEAGEVEKHIREEAVGHSGALMAYCADTDRTYFTGALARVNASWDKLCKQAKVAAAKAGLRPPEYNPFSNNVAQAIEIVDSLERCAELCRKLADPAFGGSSEPVEFTVKAGTGVGFTEAPRGAVFHKLSFDEDGRVTAASILTPTAQNVANLERDMHTLAEKLLLDGADEDTIKLEIEKLVRAYDPCFSCSVH